MFKQFIAWMMVGFLLPYGLKAQTSGGPDSFGYTWVANDDPNGKPFQWVDISTTGTLVTGLGDDNFIGPLPIGFTFRYYWLDYTQFYVGSNGYVSFGSGGNISSTSSGFPIQPEQGGVLNNFVALLLSDLTFTDVNGNPVPNAEVRYQTIGDSLVISFLNVPFWTDETPEHYRGSNTFQLILSKADSSLTLNYLSSTGTVDGSYQQSGVNFITRGMENVTGAVGLSFPINVYPTANSNIFVDYPQNITLSIRDAQAEWVLNPQNGGIFAQKGVPFNASAGLKNTGTVAIDTGNVRIIASYINQNFSVVMRDTVFYNAAANPIAPGQTVIINFPKPVTPAASGAFAYRIQISPLFTGEYAANNTLITSVDVIDPQPSDSIITLAYDDNNFDPQGSDGIITLDAGAYFEPPFYPAEVKGASFGLVPLVNATPANQNGFIAKFYDKNFNLIETVTVLPSQTVIDFTNGMPVYNEAKLQSPYSLSSPGDGIYVSFQLILVDSIRTPLITDASAHISRRTYETIGGIWSPYRSLNDEDFGIRLLITNPYFNSTQTKVTNSTFTLGQSYPNPTQDAVTIPYSLQSPSVVTLTVKDLLGRTVYSHHAGYQSTGEHSINFSTQELSNGVYTYTLRAGDHEQTLKMVVQH